MSESDVQSYPAGGCRLHGRSDRYTSTSRVVPSSPSTGKICPASSSATTSIVVSVSVLKPCRVSVGMMTTSPARASPPLRGDRYVQLARQNAQNLLTVVQVDWPTFPGG
jgi:hypothetical protein